jgi:hypothetical protein
MKLSWSAKIKSVSTQPDRYPRQAQLSPGSDSDIEQQFRLWRRFALLDPANDLNDPFVGRSSATGRNHGTAAHEVGIAR